jgi:hypothetical protein
MNERIRELYEQARLQAKSIDADIDPKGWMDLYHQKFAELILKETISVLQKRFMGDLNREDMEVRRCIADIQKHFGVEE